MGWYNQKRCGLEGRTLNLRKYGWLFFTTLLIGGLGGVIAGMIMAPDKVFSGTIGNFFVVSGMHLLIGFTISIVAQMGFFAYMTINYLALSLFKSSSLWKSVQVFFILFTFFDFIYLSYTVFGQGGSIWPYVVEPTLLLLIALVTAYGKVRLTNPAAWIPTVFFMFVVTTIEWIPALKQNDVRTHLIMVVPLLFCNVWQIMQLHRLVKKES
jgi:KinB signaling pathway activation protein